MASTDWAPGENCEENNKVSFIICSKILLSTKNYEPDFQTLLNSKKASFSLCFLILVKLNPWLQVTSHQGPEELHNALKGCHAVAIPAGVPRKPGVLLKIKI